MNATDQDAAFLTVLDSRQLERIQSVHRGFLYQHLYAASCLLSAARSGTKVVRVETDEDVEIASDTNCSYVQVKTRSESLGFSDIEETLKRFDAIRTEHAAGRRRGAASFAVVSNVAPGPALIKRIESSDWPADVAINWPEGDSPPGGLPRPWKSVNEALADVTQVASALPFAKLAGDTLTWKLAGCIQAAAAGLPPRADHAFRVDELHRLFEQLVVQLHDFPAPPLRYRPQADEPPLITDKRIRIIKGFSGAGKTSWASQAALHVVGDAYYFNVADIPSTALVGTVARELAARLFGTEGGRLGEVLLPGASGGEILLAINRALSERGQRTTLVVDNAHRVSADDVRALTTNCSNLDFVLLCQPSPAVQAMELLLAVDAVELRGWTTDTIAAEGLALGCRGDFLAYDRLRALTGALPLYVQSALRIARESDGDVERFCSELEAQTHLAETAQELILKRVVSDLSPSDRAGLGALSLADAPLSREEALELLHQSAALDARQAASLFRVGRTIGLIQHFGGDHVKVHDAVRPIARGDLETDKERLTRAQEALKNILLASLPSAWSLQKVSQLMRLFVALRQTKPLVELATDEIFHEMGLMAEISGYLEQLVAADETPPEDRFWALDGLVFGAFKDGNRDVIGPQLDAMARLVSTHSLGPDERLAVAMKRMLFAAREKRVDDVVAAAADLDRDLPDKPEYLRIARYNFAHAMYELGRNRECVSETEDLIREYFEVLGITPEDIFMKNPDKIAPLLPRDRDNQDDCKHLADCMDLCAHALTKDGRVSGTLRLNAMKFYALAHSFDSHFRVGQDLVDEFVARQDYIGARGVLESNLLPVLNQLRLAGWMVPIRSQYAVVLAYCGAFDKAEMEMARLAPYEAGLTERGRIELRTQRAVITKMRRVAPPPQWAPPHLLPTPRSSRKIRPNEPCYCGSGKKFKKCHGRL